MLDPILVKIMDKEAGEDVSPTEEQASEEYTVLVKLAKRGVTLLNEFLEGDDDGSIVEDKLHNLGHHLMAMYASQQDMLTALKIMTSVEPCTGADLIKLGMFCGIALAIDQMGE